MINNQLGWGCFLSSLRIGQTQLIPLGINLAELLVHNVCMIHPHGTSFCILSADTTNDCTYTINNLNPIVLDDLIDLMKKES